MCSFRCITFSSPHTHTATFRTFFSGTFWRKTSHVAHPVRAARLLHGLQVLLTLLDQNSCLCPPKSQVLVNALKRIESNVYREILIQETLFETSSLSETTRGGEVRCIGHH